MRFLEKYGVSRSRVRNLLLVILLLIFLVSAVLFFLSLWESKNGDFRAKEEYSLNSVLRYNGKEYVLKENLETYLFLGLDKFEGETVESYNNNMQADFLMLLVVDNKASSFSALHINRDTIAEMNILGVAGDKVGTVKKQIALAHTYGNGKEVSCRNTANAISKLLKNIKIDHYVSVKMDAIPVFNDLVGGVEVDILDDFSGIDDTLVSGQRVTLMGEHALNYVRTRKGLEDSSNNSRMKRQKQYLEALHAKTRQCFSESTDFINQSVVELTDYIVSDCSVNKMQTLGEKISTYEFVKMHDIEGKFVKGERFMEFYPDDESVLATTVNLFYKLQG